MYSWRVVLLFVLIYFKDNARLSFLQNFTDITSLTHLHLGTFGLSALQEFSGAKNIHVFELSLKLREAPETIIGIEEFPNLKKVIINVDEINPSYQRLKNSLRVGLMPCEIELKTPIIFQ
ncbi:MAG: hypothetical protein L0154_05220 [Chloroflexi bacterium]|nr:hypothetical protein [Chloroflexota bacterium]